MVQRLWHAFTLCSTLPSPPPPGGPPDESKRHTAVDDVPTGHTSASSQDFVHTPRSLRVRRSFGAGLLTTGRRLARRGRNAWSGDRGMGVYMWRGRGSATANISCGMFEAFCLLGFPQRRWWGAVRVRVLSPCDSAECFFFAAVEITSVFGSGSKNIVAVV
ncbi:unnamed protein product [Ectocarpus sp. 12 AP-2014]